MTFKALVAVNLYQTSSSAATAPQVAAGVVVEAVAAKIFG